MHLLPDSAEDAESVGIENYPTAYLFAVVGFFVVFFVQKVLTPLLTPSDLQPSQASYGQGSCCSSGAAAMLGKVRRLQKWHCGLDPEQRGFAHKWCRTCNWI